MSANSSNLATSKPIPFVKILHQPSPFYRMRYKAEKRTTFLFAENATLANQNEANNQAANASSSASSSSATIKSRPLQRKKNGILHESPEGTFPRIQIVHGQGPATLIVSCVNKCEPFHIHPHRLIGECCKSGVAVINIQKGETYFDLAGVSIEFTKKSDIEESINELKSKNVDPFNVGFDFDRNAVDLTQLRLCFQVYLRESLESNDIIRDQFHILKPVVSQVIRNLSRKSTLSVMKSFNMSSPSIGGNTVILFIKKLDKDQKPLQVKIYDETGWNTIIKLTDQNVHHQSAIWFDAPPYRITDNDKDINVSLKIFVPFSSENERQEFNKQQKEEEEDESMDSSAISTNENQQEGKYESKILEFVYKPQYITHQKRKLNTAEFYDFNDPNERDATNEINPSVKKKLANRQYDLLSDNFEQSVAIPDILNSSKFKEQPSLSQGTSIDPPMINHFLAYQNSISFLSTNNINNDELEFDSLEIFKTTLDQNYQNQTLNSNNNYDSTNNRNIENKDIFQSKNILPNTSKAVTFLNKNNEIIIEESASDLSNKKTNNNSIEIQIHSDKNNNNSTNTQQLVTGSFIDFESNPNDEIYFSDFFSTNFVDNISL